MLKYEQKLFILSFQEEITEAPAGCINSDGVLTIFIFGIRMSMIISKILSAELLTIVALTGV